MNRPTPVKTDNFFLLIFRALRHRRVPIALRIASHNVILVALALVIYACVMGLQFKQAMHEQADALGESLTTQTATSATELLVSNDILSLNVLLNNLTKNKLVAHAAIYSVDNRILAESGQRPKHGLLGEAEGMYESKITFQDVTAGQLRISLDMDQFQQPMTISLQSMGILSAILLALSLALSLRLGRHISTPLLQLRVWLRRIDEYTPGIERQDEIGDLARQLHANYAPEPAEPEPEPEPSSRTTSRNSKCATCVIRASTKAARWLRRSLRHAMWSAPLKTTMTKTRSPICVTSRWTKQRNPQCADRPQACRNIRRYWRCNWVHRNNCAVYRAHDWKSCRIVIAIAWSRLLRCIRAKSKP